MPLDIPTLLDLAPTCAPAVAPSTLAAVAQVESGLDPFAIGVNGPKPQRIRPQSKAEAIRAASALIASGRNVDLGVAQINVRNLAWLGLSVSDAFDPCANLAASARVLADGYRRAAPPPGGEQQGLRTALSYYNTGHPSRGLANGDVAKVVAAAANLALTPAAGPKEGRSAPPSWDVFGAGRPPHRTFVFTPSSGETP